MNKADLIKLLKSKVIPDDVEVYFSCDGVLARIDDVRLEKKPKDGVGLILVLRQLPQLFPVKHKKTSNSNKK